MKKIPEIIGDNKISAYWNVRNNIGMYKIVKLAVIVHVAEGYWLEAKSVARYVCMYVCRYVCIRSRSAT